MPGTLPQLYEVEALGYQVLVLEDRGALGDVRDDGRQHHYL